jgi:predicted metal-binding membrane protein
MTTAASRLPAMHALLTADAHAGLNSPAARWLLAPAAAAWLMLLGLGSDQTFALCLAPRSTLLEGFLANLAAGMQQVEPARWAIEWTLMIVAMMFPLLVPMVGHVATRSFAASRERSVGFFVGSFFFVWLTAAAGASLALVLSRAALQAFHLTAWAGLIGSILAASWQLSNAKIRAINRCHGTIALRPWPGDADRDAIGFGLLHGARCVRACLPVMILPLIGGQGLAAMAAVSATLLAERARKQPQYRLSAVVILLLGLLSLVP